MRRPRAPKRSATEAQDGHDLRLGHASIQAPQHMRDLFRYSALTFNGHRIHYDADYCRQVEGYANLVVHGPLNATMLAGFAQQVAGRPRRVLGATTGPVTAAVAVDGKMIDRPVILRAQAVMQSLGAPST